MERFQGIRRYIWVLARPRWIVYRSIMTQSSCGLVLASNVGNLSTCHCTVDRPKAQTSCSTFRHLLGFLIKQKLGHNTFKSLSLGILPRVISQYFLKHKATEPMNAQSYCTKDVPSPNTTSSNDGYRQQLRHWDGHANEDICNYAKMTTILPWKPILAER